MKRIIMLFATLVIMLSLLGCSDQNAPLSLLESTSSETSDLAKGPKTSPGQSGPIVLRSETTMALFCADPDKGIAAVYGLDIVDFCNEIENFDIFDLKEVNVPSDVNRIIQLVKGKNVRTSVWPFILIDNCDQFKIAPLATGTVDLVYTNNDVYPYWSEKSKNAHVFGFTAHGKLTGPDGELLHFNSVHKYRWDGSNPATFKQVSKINLH